MLQISEQGCGEEIYLSNKICKSTWKIEWIINWGFPFLYAAFIEVVPQIHQWIVWLNQKNNKNQPK